MIRVPAAAGKNIKNAVGENRRIENSGYKTEI